ncbi:hypothetical protein RND71_014266 [Anisodus tanguticus]|uniref:Plastocyanin-like domain-containing protein n=1 Tax=Anisodus tanguticus TaxID=243964 RepID=A0AAE1VJS2_9SOLA|nr:hypothetical protein RND71_014266 [Anisodus tanguticus]
MQNKDHCNCEWEIPGPRVVARAGDRLVVKVVNHVSNNVNGGMLILRLCD